MYHYCIQNTSWQCLWNLFKSFGLSFRHQLYHIKTERLLSQNPGLCAVSRISKKMLYVSLWCSSHLWRSSDFRFSCGRGTARHLSAEISSTKIKGSPSEKRFWNVGSMRNSKSVVKYMALWMVLWGLCPAMWYLWKNFIWTTPLPQSLNSQWSLPHL